MSFLYETVFQGVLQTGLHQLTGLAGHLDPFSLGVFFASVAGGTVGEYFLSDRGLAAYQETRVMVRDEVRTANMRLIGMLGSILSVDGVLMSMNHSLAGAVSIASMTATGLGMIYYFRNTLKIAELGVVKAVSQSVKSFVQDATRAFKTGVRSICNRLLNSAEE